MDAAVELERLEETPQHTNHPLLPAAFRQILQEVRRAFGYPLAGERGEIGRGVVISHNYFTNINLFKYDNKRSIRIGK